MKTLVCLITVTLCLSLVAAAQTQFVKYKGSPVLRVEGSSTWDNPGVSTGSLLFDGSSYRMWYRGWSTSWTGVGHATSQDGIHWLKYLENPILNSRAMWPGCVLIDSGQYHMYYLLNPSGETYQVMHATSTDGISWALDNTNSPLSLLGNYGAWDDYLVSPRSILQRDSVWMMWYNAFHPGAVFKIGYAISKDGIHWTKPSAFPVIAEGTGWDIGGTAIGDLLFEQSEYRLWYSNGQSLGYATSSDGRSWAKFTRNPILSEVWTADDSADQGAFIGLCRVVHKGGVYKMWYDQKPNNGAGLTLSQIALAVDSDSGFVMAHPYQIAFGSAKIGQPGSAKPICIMNYGRHEVQVQSVSFTSPHYRVTNMRSMPFTLAPSARDTLFVQFTPQIAGNITDTLSIRSNSAADTLFNVYLSGSGTPAVSVDDERIPPGFALEQNWPNPFNPRTVVRSSVPPLAGRDLVSTSGRDGRTPEASNVRIVIYDLLGREVKVLVNERRAAGCYEDTVDGSSLASGVYVYRMTAGSFVRSRKMILVK